MAIFVITNCTNRKRRSDETVRPNGLRAIRNVGQLAEAWTRKLQSSTQRIPICTLYQGRTFSDSKQVAEHCGARLHVVSAGLGYVDCEQLAPRYEFTITDGQGSIREWLIERNSHVTDWWLALNSQLGQHNPISNHINRSGANDVFILALPSTYFELIASDLAQVQAGRTEALRILTSTAGIRTLPEHLRRQAMPYDDRLDGLPPYSGTRGDFPQRAMRHFVEQLNGHRKPTSIGIESVLKALALGKRKVIPQRTKMNDNQIIHLIESNWTLAGGRASRLLRVLRDTELVACEQSRFSSLWRKVHAQRNS